MNYLKTMDLSGNNFNFKVKDLGDLNGKHLQELLLADNFIGGSLPRNGQFHKLSSLRILDLSDNELQGVM